MAPGRKLHLLSMCVCRWTVAKQKLSDYRQQPTLSLGNTPVLNHVRTNPSGAGQHPGAVQNICFSSPPSFWGDQHLIFLSRDLPRL